MSGAAKQTPGPLYIEIARILRAQQASLQLTQGDVAYRMGNIISRNQIGMYLRGLRVPDIQELDWMCTALELDFVEVNRVADDRSRDRRLAPGWPTRR